MVHKKSQLSKLRNKNRRSYDGISGDRRGYYNQKGIYLSVDRPSVAFGPPFVKQGIESKAYSQNSQRLIKFDQPYFVSF